MLRKHSVFGAIHNLVDGLAGIRVAGFDEARVAHPGTVFVRGESLLRGVLHVIIHFSNDNRFASPDPQIVDAFQGGAAYPADDGMAVAAHYRVGDRPGAGGAVEFGCLHATWRRRWNRP